MKPITVYCSRCHRPLAVHLVEVKERTECCIPGPRFEARRMASGERYWYSDGAIVCSTEVRFPRGTLVD